MEAKCRVIDDLEVLQAKNKELREVLKKKIVKCCDTCDSFGENKILEFHCDGRCPFDSKGHKKEDVCGNWNIDGIYDEQALKEKE